MCCFHFKIPVKYKILCYFNNGKKDAQLLIEIILNQTDNNGFSYYFTYLI